LNHPESIQGSRQKRGKNYAMVARFARIFDTDHLPVHLRAFRLNIHSQPQA
jgi:hypothetical protein